tara:strand:+ start:530 stop:1021 length:492 start_codon:yes stop_codon:yes gene_type:complete
MSDSSGAIKYEQLPSNAVEYLELDYDNSLVKIIFKSNLMKQYCYKCEDLEDFQSKFMELSGQLEAEQDRDDEDNLVESEEDTVQREDASIGRFINDRIRAGYLKIDTVLTQHPDMLDVGWEPFNGSTMPKDGVVLEDTKESVTDDQLEEMRIAIMEGSITPDT